MANSNVIKTTYCNKEEHIPLKSEYNKCLYLLSIQDTTSLLFSIAWLKLYYTQQVNSGVVHTTLT